MEENAVEPDSMHARDGPSRAVYETTSAPHAEKTTHKKGFVRLTGARMARTLENPEGEMVVTPVPDKGFNLAPWIATPLAHPHADVAPSETTHIPPSTDSAARAPVNQTFWDSSRYQPGTSQIIPSLPTLSTVSSAPVLQRDMSVSRKSMVGEMGEYEYEDEPTAGSLSPRTSVRKGKSAEESGNARPQLVNRHSRMHYTRRPAPPPPPVPSIPANFLQQTSSPKLGGASSARRPSLTTANSYANPTRSPRPQLETRAASHGHMTSEERRAKIAEDYLTKGITAHNDTTGQHDLSESTYYFRKAAENGSSGGCVLYGLALRHGWGVAQDEKAAFTWFGRACELTMLADEVQVENNDLLAKKNKSKLTPELIMALYEVGNCFFHGWGLPHPDYAMAVSYFKLAAESGDRDAQEQLGLILSQGKPGVKKDMHEAARWYRTAIAQGASGVGLSWVYKDKYMGGETSA
ncbi:hypothetical protein NCC49_001891 [Naganishia albida]|nr:hypothetical protein NCC49_001891 [Naganishia albida]